MSTFIIFSSFLTSLKVIFPSLFLSAFWNQSQTHLRRGWGKTPAQKCKWLVTERRFVIRNFIKSSHDQLFALWHFVERRQEVSQCLSLNTEHSDLLQYKGYWSSLSFSSMVWVLWISLRTPWIQAWASSGESATRSRLPWRPWNTKVKQRSAGNSSAMLSRTSDWWPSRTASSSLMETKTWSDCG